MAQLGRYEILQQLARGSVADVLLARATGTAGFARHVVIKRIRPEVALDQRFVTAFLAEARIGAALNHQNIVQVFDVDREGGNVYFAMEYVHGEDARKLLQKTREQDVQVPIDQVVAIGAAAAAGLHHAHELLGPDRLPLGLVHRDVSPSNILIGYDGSVKLVDFGLAKAALRSAKTRTGSLSGKAPYMSPELCNGTQIDRRSDVFALGIVLFELATSRRLFKGDNDFLTMAAIVEGEIHPPSQYRPDLPPELDAIIMRALARAPADRYQTAQDLRADLERFAIEHELRTTSKAIADYMAKVFGPRQEPWQTQSSPVAVDSSADFDDAQGLVRPPRATTAISAALAPDAVSPLAIARNLAKDLPDPGIEPEDEPTRAVADLVDPDEEESDPTTIDGGQSSLSNQTVLDRNSSPSFARAPSRPDDQTIVEQPGSTPMRPPVPGRTPARGIAGASVAPAVSSASSRDQAVIATAAQATSEPAVAPALGTPNSGMPAPRGSMTGLSVGTPLPAVAPQPSSSGPAIGRTPTPQPSLGRAPTPSSPNVGRTPTPQPSLGRAPTPSSPNVGRSPTQQPNLGRSPTPSSPAPNVGRSPTQQPNLGRSPTPSSPAPNVGRSPTQQPNLGRTPTPSSPAPNVGRASGRAPSPTPATVSLRVGRDDTPTTKNPATPLDDSLTTGSLTGLGGESITQIPTGDSILTGRQRATTPATPTTHDEQTAILHNGRDRARPEAGAEEAPTTVTPPLFPHGEPPPPLPAIEPHGPMIARPLAPPNIYVSPEVQDPTASRLVRRARAWFDRVRLLPSFRWYAIGAGVFVVLFIGILARACSSDTPHAPRSVGSTPSESR